MVKRAVYIFNPLFGIGIGQLAIINWRIFRYQTRHCAEAGAGAQGFFINVIGQPVFK